MAISIKFSAAQVAKATMAVRTLDSETRREVGRVIAKYALLIEADAKRLAPVDTGRLRASIHHELKEAAKEIVARVQDGVNYGIYQELGTRFHGAQPFLRPALDKHRDAFTSALKDAIERAAKTTGRRFA